ncbi:hypothetical protein PO909_025544, partial [Leuciscus waleckii]
IRTDSQESHELPASPPDKNTFLWAQELVAWPPVKEVFADQNFIHVCWETVLSKTCRVCL